MTFTRPLLSGVLATAVALLVAPNASADLADEQALAERFAPVVRLVEQEEECGPGEPYDPLDVDLLLDGEPTVALRGPWLPTDLVKIGPAAADLVNRFEYHLDFPGNPLDAGCGFERWSRRLAAGSTPAVYAHVASQDGYPDKLALQYWLFYAFNDFNNTHEGDWEMIQLVFDAGSAREALGTEPAEVGYSAHEGAERAEWGDDELEIVDGTHPVVFPGAGSHANKFTEALYLGSSAEAGVGCDDTRGPHREVRPDVVTIPSDPDEARAAFPWIDFEGRWGELQPAFFNGPTGPNMKTQWTRPIEWSEVWSDRSYGVPTGGLFGTGATDLFCTGVEKGSRALILLLRSPGAILLVLAALIGLVAFVVVHATWTPVAPLRIARRRAWGQILAASGRMYVKRPRLFLGIGVALIPIVFVMTLLQWVALEGLDATGITSTGESAGGSAFLAVVIGTTFALLGLAFCQAATACALVELDRGKSIAPVTAYRVALRRTRPLLGAVALFVVVWVVLTSTAFLIPVAIWLAVRWCLVAPVIELEELGAIAALRRSTRLVRGRWSRIGSLVGLSAAIALVVGPLLGALLIFTTNLPLAFLNLVSGIVYAAALPFVGIVTAYAYLDARARVELAPEPAPKELPAEIELAT
ncbi:MAG TPA: hypothetical protein VLA69_04075 [Gaiellaceae bacterium]|nr:hypothetical protein [Gaiellaceae bacterium]